MQSSEINLTLDDVKNNMNNWRLSKKGGKIPEKIWKQIEVLEKFCNPVIIRRSLKISNNQYKLNLAKLKTPTSFIDVTSQVNQALTKREKFQPLNIISNSTIINIQRADGNCLSINSADHDVISNIISAFLR